MALFVPSRNHGIARGKLALVRQVALTGVMHVIDGLPLTAQTATLLLALYDRLSFHDQEEFAAGCSLSFWQCAQQLLSASGPSATAGVVVVLWAKK